MFALRLCTFGCLWKQLFGATLVGLGVWMRADRESPFYLELLRSIPASPILTIDQLPVAVIAVGGCVAILSFLGCCGACFESICFLCMVCTIGVINVRKLIKKR